MIDGPAHRAVARDATAASIVLLKNDLGLLPLAKSAKVAAIGPYMCPELQPSMSGNTQSNVSGNVGSMNPYVHAYGGSSSVMVNFLQGLNLALDTPATFVQGCESNQTSHDDPSGVFAAAKQAAAAADVTVLAVGLTLKVRDAEGVGHETEMLDRLSLELPRVQRNLIAAVRSVAKKVVLVIVSGSAVPFDESAADAAIYAMYGGAQAGNGLADVLFGAVAPSGRLPFTVFTSLVQIKDMEDYDLVTQPGRTHLYYDNASVAKLGEPQFWFGFGLGYTSFTHHDATFSAGPGCTATATVTVTNTGNVASREVTQLYLNRPGLPAAPWALKGYSRTVVLAPGASVVATFALSPHDLSTVLSNGTRVIPAGWYRITVGGGHPRDPRVQTTATASFDMAARCAY